MSSKNWDESSVNLAVFEYHISIWLTEDSVVPWLLWNNTGLHNQPQGVPTEDAAMLNVSVHPVLRGIT